jgi:hypothetical protein
MTSAVTTYLYRIDSTDAITFVSPAWLQFAQDNDAPELNAKNVLGSSLWTHVTGEHTRRLYALLFNSLRASRQESAIPFNCDSPTTVRHMTLTLRGLAGGAIELEGRVNLTQERPYTPLLDRRATRSDATVAICSVCRRLQIDDAWVAVDKAIGRQRWLTSVSVPKLDESLCPMCHGMSA